MSDTADRRPSRPSYRPPPFARGGAGEADDAAPDSTPSTRVVDEDFLYHLYRGSELLQDNCVTEAKEELERALAVRPRDVEGQGLLGVVYFRLGLYPRAIEIFEELLRSFPQELAPRMNLALSYLKTGQQHRARELLEVVVQRAPEHRRAWGYLGLVFERLGEVHKAEAAFERAGQQAMARRMRERVSAALAGDDGDASLEGVRTAAAAAVIELDLEPSPFSRAEGVDVGPASVGGRWRAHEPGRDATLGTSRPPPSPTTMVAPADPEASIDPARQAAGQVASAVDALPRDGEPHSRRPDSRCPDSRRAGVPSVGPGLPGSTPHELVRRHRLAEPAEGVAQHDDRTAVVRVHDAITVRTSAVRALVSDADSFRAAPAYRRARGRPLDEVLGGADASLGELTGRGVVFLGATAAGARLVPVELVPGELLYVREAFLVAFAASVRHESGRLPRGDAGHHAVVQLAGVGTVVLELQGRLHAIPVGAGVSAVVPSDQVVGWTGRLFPRAIEPAQTPGGGRGFVGFTGEGAVLLAFD